MSFSQKPRTRRVPIEVVDAPSTTSTRNDLLTPVSSRPLNRPSPTTPLIDTVLTPGTVAPRNKQPEQRLQRNETKRTGGAKYGGGIFRSSGSHTIFRSENSSASHTRPQSDRRARPAMDLSAFTSSWNTPTTDKHKWTLLQQIPPASLSGFFGSSLGADILSSMLGVLFTTLSSGESEHSLVKEYMVYLTRVPRFSLIFTFLSRDDKNHAKEIWILLDGAGVTSEEDDGIKKSWDA